MAGKRGRKAKEPEVVEEVDNEQNAEEAPKKKRGRPNPKSDVKAEQKKGGQSKPDDEESKDSEDEAKNEEEMEESNDEPKEKAESDVIDEKENGAEDDKEEPEEVDEKPKRGRGRQKKEATKEKKPAAKQAAKGKQKKTAKKAEASDSNEEDDDKVEIVEEKKSAPKRKGRAAKGAHKNGDVESSPKRSSGRNANKKISYADEGSEDEVVEMKSSKRGRGGRSKKVEEEEDDDDDDSESEKVDKEVRVVLEHCKSCQVYRRNAVALKEAFERAFVDIDVCINPEKPRRGSFECVLVKEDGSKVVLWSGIDKGPPRKLKFPDHQELVSRLQSELKL